MGSDGMRTDYLQQARQLGLSTLTRLIEGGTLAAASQTVWPAVTFPSHTRQAAPHPCTCILSTHSLVRAMLMTLLA